MIQKLKDKFNAIRLERAFKKRKVVLSKEIDHDKINHLKPGISCSSSWYGNSYGGFFINPDLLTENSIIYSIGIGTDITFDLSCIKNHDCEVFAFDPTPKSIAYVARTKTPASFHFQPFGISELISGATTFYLSSHPKGTSGSLEVIEGVSKDRSIEVEMKTFSDMTSELNHTHIDVLKMDIEGAEYAVLSTVIDSDVVVDQILVEFHDRSFDQEDYRSKEITAQLRSKGYEIFNHSETFEEISFIRTAALKSK